MVIQRERRRFTPEEYLRLEDQSEFKSEYCDGEIFAMTGGSLNHNRILLNLVEEVRRSLQGRPCEVFSSDVRLLVERFTLFTYPDLLVVCGPPSLMKEREDTLTDARLIAEVLSTSTEAYDRGEKFRMYRALPSLQDYLLIAQSEVRVERHQRQAEHEWLWTEWTDPGDRLVVPSLQVEIPLDRIYRGIAFS
ncbi:MAG: Uma2 family endonuclease [Candidatus Eremiobacterota bacterium]